MQTKTKIVATLGPASSSEKEIKKLILAGVNLFRLNFSHGEVEEHLERIKKIRKISSQLGKSVAIIQDLSGPKIRLGELEQGQVQLKTGEIVRLFYGKKSPSPKRLPVSYPRLSQDLAKGDQILLGDGEIELKVVSVEQNEVICQVVVGGAVSSHKGVNLPSEKLSVSALTKKDKKDLDVGIKAEVDFIALSFIRRAQEILMVKKLIKRYGREIPIIAKIETSEALKNLEQIIKASDAVMVARGDLGVEVPIEKIPVVQKKIIQLANTLARPVITATQMLKSMVESKRPTRAEVTDVANAIFDGADALMLSEETAIGKYPVETVKMMKKIASQAEKHWQKYYQRSFPPAHNIPEAISYSAFQLAEQMDAKAIITPTRSGYTARLVSRFRPKAKILALTPKSSTLRALCLVWGVEAECVPYLEKDPKILENASQLAKAKLKLKKGDIIVITAGLPIEKPGITNLVKLEKIS